MRVGIEVGGTFTDLICFAGSVVKVVKVPSAPRRPDEGVYAALEQAGIDIGAIDELVHGSTVATNTVIERRGAKVAFVTTSGFRDILAIQRHDRERVYDLAYAKAEPIVPRRHCFEVTERILADGSVEQPLDVKATETSLIPALVAGGYDAVAICLLNSYRNPAHETALAELIRKGVAGVAITISSDVSREFREYERASTTVLAAYVKPVIDSYLQRLEGYLGARRFAGRFSLMQSNGGRMPCAGMRENPVTALFSGPAAGVMGATSQGVKAGHSDLITFDMGGTSTDVCLVEAGRAELTSQTVVDGLPLRTPLFDIVSVGAGCGSVVWVDEGGMLRVGPKSAGADPGPACYGRGGAEPTITDAHVIRGTIRPEAFLGGAMRIDRRAADGAFAGLASHFGLDLTGIAARAIRIAEANIVRAIQVVSTQRGRDPRDFALVAFGGAGPLHAANVADELDIRTVLIPPHAGVLSAYGLLASDYRNYETMTRRVFVDEAAPGAIRTIFAELKERALRRAGQLGFPNKALTFTLALGMRFVGQSFEVNVEIDADRIEGLTLERLRERFVEEHYRLYFHGAAGRNEIEIVSFRIGMSAPADQIPSLGSEGGAMPEQALHRIQIGDERVPCALLERRTLADGKHVRGYAMIEDTSSTIFVPAGWQAALDSNANIILTKVA